MRKYVPAIYQKTKTLHDSATFSCLVRQKISPNVLEFPFQQRKLKFASVKMYYFNPIDKNGAFSTFLNRGFHKLISTFLKDNFP